MIRNALILAVASSLPPCAARAQNSVTLYGVLDAGITFVSNQGGHSNLIVDTGEMQANRWGIQGTEDLGGGMKAVFKLESSFSLSNGASSGGLAFSRVAAVGLSNDYGTITLGRQYDFMNDFLQQYTSGNEFAGAYDRRPLDIDRIGGEDENSSIKYVSANLSGFTLGAMYGFSGAPGQFGGAAGAPRYTSFGLNYAGGPLSGAIAYANTNGAGGSLAEGVLKATALRNWGAGAQYNFGSLTIYGNYTNSRASGALTTVATAIQVFDGGFVWFVTPAVNLGLGYSFVDWQDADLNRFNAGVHYFLSKRTDVYATAILVRSNSSSQPAGIFTVVNPATNTGYSSNRNQLAVRLAMRTHF
ncbi:MULTISPECIES: porin [Paraburkholderia]|uniref:porin n=1 Tax=Paraburkholderia TaxID=1822464 RepID=UPI0006B3F174|nr:hypothetical protein AC233_11290 [Burkholderia sp. HB1]OWJ56361.1 porin [Burkholderia sp. Bk]